MGTAAQGGEEEFFYITPKPGNQIDIIRGQPTNGGAYAKVFGLQIPMIPPASHLYVNSDFVVPVGGYVSFPLTTLTQLGKETSYLLCTAMLSGRLLYHGIFVGWQARYHHDCDCTGRRFETF